MFLLGDTVKVLQAMKDNTIQCVVTSPPYWGLRDYKVDGQLGLEKTPEEYVAKMVRVFCEVRRVLRNDGTLWLNLGDTYSSHKDCKSIGQTLAKGTTRENAHVIPIGQSHSRNTRMLKAQGLKNKDLIGIPWRVAFALQADGWWLRSDIIWSKPNPMPESVTDRPTKAHEYLFLLTKRASYYFDQDAIREPHTTEVGPLRNFAHEDYNQAFLSSRGNGERTGYHPLGKNKRSVWSIPSCSYEEAHFATFPEKLIEPCILAGSKPGDVVLDPFSGSGTTVAVAERFGRRGVGIELNPSYIQLAQKRCYGQPLSLGIA